MSDSPPKTVMFLDHTAKMGGGEYALLHLVERLDRKRFKPLVVLFSDGDLRERLVKSGVETVIFPLSSNIVSTRKDTLGARGLLQGRRMLQILGFCWRLSKLMKKRGAAIVHTNSLKADIIGGISARMAGVPVLWHIRDRIENDYLPRPAVFAFRWLSRVLPNYIITNSLATLKTLQLPRQDAATTIYSGVEWNNADSLVSVVHDGVVEENFTVEDEEKSEPLLGIVGRITRWKGQHIFLQAASQVSKEFPEARFQIIGSSMFGEEDYGAELEQIVKDLQLEERVEFTGFIANISERLKKLDILVHASITSEPFGLVIVEGMVAGKPVVATRGGGVLETVKDGETGILVPMGDADAMAEAMKYLLRNPEKAREMGLAGRQRVRECFTINLTVQRVQEVYEEIFRRRDGQNAKIKALAAARNQQLQGPCDN
jgi:glycosyltransferase involved in cell wall biosynthesis